MSKQIRFTKMHGLGNDYVYVDCFAQSLDGIDRPALSRRVADRHRGIGSDGLILIAPPSPGVDADVRMEMYNADGSRGEMCGNGIRCVAKYAIEHILSPEKRRLLTPPLTKGGPGGVAHTASTLRVETDRGVLHLVAYADASGIVEQVRVDMGPPILSPAQIPMKHDAGRCIAAPMDIGGLALTITAVSMGNPHAVAFVDDVKAFDLARIGPLVEHHPPFPNRVNFHIAQVHSRGEATMRTWERGSGMTQACGTGACAVHVAGVLEGRLDRASLLHLPGGDLKIEWPEDAASVFKTGPAEEVFTGQWHIA